MFFFRERQTEVSIFASEVSLHQFGGSFVTFISNNNNCNNCNKRSPFPEKPACFRTPAWRRRWLLFHAPQLGHDDMPRLRSRRGRGRTRRRGCACDETSAKRSTVPKCISCINSGTSQASDCGRNDETERGIMPTAKKKACVWSQSDGKSFALAHP